MVGAQSLPRWLATSLVPSTQCSWCVTHLTVMPSEPLTLFIGSSASSTIPVFVHLKRWRPLYTNPFKVDDTLYLVLHSSRGEVPWCGHRCALPISRSHKWELCSCGRPVLLSTSIMTRMHGWQAHKGTTPQRTTLTPLLLQYCYIPSYGPHTCGWDLRHCVLRSSPSL